MIHRKMQKMLKLKLPKRPEFFLLEIDLGAFEKNDKVIIWYMIAVARILYVKYWKLDKTPKTIEWLNKLIFFPRK